MSGNFRDKFSMFMSGRNGLDEFGKALNIVSLILIILSFFIRILTIPVIILLVYEYFRIFSRNIPARNAENMWFCRTFHRRFYGNSNKVNRNTRDNLHKIYKCPNCSQKIRVPRGKGKIRIRCPRCRIEFIKKT